MGKVIPKTERQFLNQWHGVHSQGFDMLILLIGRLSRAGSLLHQHVQPGAEKLSAIPKLRWNSAETLRTKKSS